MIRKLFVQAIIALALSSLNAYGYSDNECILCHGIGSRESSLQIDVDDYMKSIHAGEAGCAECHGSITGDEHTKGTGVKKVDCGLCHEQENLHSKDGSVKCAECHTRHAVYGTDDPRSSVNWRNLKDTCKACHAEQAGSPAGLSWLVSFKIISHSKQNLSKDYDKGMCVGCHQGKAAHGEDGIVNSQDCYKCHSPLDDKSALLGYIHPRADWQLQPVSATAAWVTLIGLIGTIFGLLRFHFRFRTRDDADHDGGKN